MAPIWLALSKIQRRIELLVNGKQTSTKSYWQIMTM